MKKLFEFLAELEEKKIYFKLDKIRDSILVKVVIPGERWEIEFFDNGAVEIEKFKSDGKMYDETEIDILFEQFSD